MNGNPVIPIQNLYYLLCYSWNQLRQGELVDVSRVPSTELVDLFALVLIDGINHLARRGLAQSYEEKSEELAGLRGRIEVLASARRFLPLHGRAICTFDELTSNTMKNQILKSTLKVLRSANNLDKGLRVRLDKTYQGLQGIDDVELSGTVFRTVQLDSNNRFYRFLLNVCELVHRSWLVDQRTGAHRFRDFIRDERAMARVFEEFLFNFIRTEISGLEVQRENIAWEATSTTDPTLRLLPTMRTDVSIRCRDTLLIIDAKYYRSTLGEYYETAKIHGQHLYQVMSYLSNARRPSDRAPRGLLIYPKTNEAIDETYLIQGYQLRVCTIDLAQDWLEIHRSLVSMVEVSLH